jgi:hypothetical protein
MEQLDAFETAGTSPPKKRRVRTEEQRARKREYLRDWTKRNPEKILKNRRRWRGSEKSRELSRRLYLRQKATSEGRRSRADAARFTLYRLRPSDYDAMVLASTGRCTICDRQDDNRKGGLVVDHCHETAVVRGLVCGYCNDRLAVLDDQTWMSAAQHYLKHAKRQHLHLVTKEAAHGDH